MKLDYRGKRSWFVLDLIEMTNHGLDKVGDRYNIVLFLYIVCSFGRRLLYRKKRTLLYKGIEVFRTMCPRILTIIETSIRPLGSNLNPRYSAYH